MENQPEALRISDLSASYGTELILQQLSFHIPAGTLTAIIGPNGAGKTTLMKCLLRLHRPLAGSIAFPLLEKEYAASYKRQIAYVPQSESIDWDFPATALDVVTMGQYGNLGWLRRPGKKEVYCSLACLERLDMLPYAKRQISQLSGGQKQRIFLARALAQNAELYLMDEPFKGIDAKTEKDIVRLLQELTAQGKTIVVVHHDLQTVREYFDYAALLDGKLIAAGPVRQVFTKENIAVAYHDDSRFWKGVF